VRAINTSIWRSSVTICSSLNLFFGMTNLLSKLFSHNAWSKKAKSGQQRMCWCGEKRDGNESVLIFPL
jgi:hypothetical protein